MPTTLTRYWCQSCGADLGHLTLDQAYGHPDDRKACACGSTNADDMPPSVEIGAPSHTEEGSIAEFNRYIAGDR